MSAYHPGRQSAIETRTSIGADLRVANDSMRLIWRPITAERECVIKYIDATECDWDGPGCEIQFPTPGLGDIADRESIILPLDDLRTWLTKVDTQLAAEAGESAA